MATIIRADGSTQDVAPRDGKYFTLTELYEHTRCDMVQRVTLADGRVMWGDEEGYYRDPMPAPNALATRLYAEAGGVPGWIVRGDVLIAAESEVE